MKFVMICKACNKVLKKGVDVSIQDIPAKCPECGEERIAVEKLFEENQKQVSFDLWITNKETSVTEQEGFTILEEDFEDQSQESIKRILIEKVASTVAVLLKEENINQLLKRE